MVKFGLSGVAAFMMLAVSGTHIWAEDALPKGTVATVNGIAITYDDISLAEDELMGLVGQLPERQRFETLVGYMVDRVLASEAAKKNGLADSPEVAKRLAYMERKALQDVHIGDILRDRVSDEKVAAYYKKNILNGPRLEEVRARHILLDSKEMAETVIAALSGGADFAQLAKEKSKGPSGSTGGDLGYFGPEAMVPEFSDAAFKLEKGGVSGPVKTQFGWHVIKLEDKRQKPLPKLADVEGQIYQILIGEARRDIYKEMRDAAEVNFVNAAPLTE